MTYVSHNFDGGTDATAITALNSVQTGQTTFDLVPAVAGDTIRHYSIDHPATGTLGAKLQNVTSTASNYMRWQAARGSIPVNSYARSYVYLTGTYGTGTSNTNLFRWWDATPTALGLVSFQASATPALERLVLVRDGGGVVKATSTTQLATGTEYRIEAWLFADTTAGFVTVRIYLGDSTTILEEVNGGGAPVTWAMASAESSLFDVGLSGTAANTPSGGALYIDSVADGATAWIGPDVPPVPPEGTAVPSYQRRFGPYQ